MKVNWETYKEDFPKRYTQPGFFDSVVEYLIKYYNYTNALDVGGGKGTELLKNNNIKTTLLDPYVKKSDWMIGQVDWLNLRNYRFQLSILRGSINYLFPTQIKSLINVSHRILANTFVNPPSEEWVTRSYGLQNGRESFRYDKKNKRIKHKLEINGKIIKHKFNYYSEDEYKNMLPEVKIIKYNKNSILLDWKYNET